MGKRTILSIGAVLAVAMLAFAAGDDFKRERNGKNDDVKNAYEGKAPPKFAFEGWLNEKKPPTDWAALKGSVILVDFWAHW